MLRADLHHHVSSDPVDGRFVHHSVGELIDRAATLGLGVLSITCHESIPYDVEDATHYAAERGILLLTGMEATVGSQHVLLINFREFPPGVCTMEDIAAAKDPGALVIAPHPFYPAKIASGQSLIDFPEVFDAVEFSGVYSATTKRFNRLAAEYARSVQLPVVGNSDTHFLWQMGRTYSLIDAPADRDKILEAIRHGRVQLQTQPLRFVDIVRFVAESQATVWALREGMRYLYRIVQRTRRAESSRLSPAT